MRCAAPGADVRYVDEVTQKRSQAAAEQDDVEQENVAAAVNAVYGRCSGDAGGL